MVREEVLEQIHALLKEMYASDRWRKHNHPCTRTIPHIGERVSGPESVIPLFRYLAVPFPVSWLSWPCWETGRRLFEIHSKRAKRAQPPPPRSSDTVGAPAGTHSGGM